MAPEQIAGQPLDGRADLFSTAIVLWEMVAGCGLFARPSDIASMMAVCDQPVPELHGLVEGAPPELDHVLQRALAKSADARYPSADQMRADLLRVAAAYGWDLGPKPMRQLLETLFGNPSALDFDDAATVHRPREPVFSDASTVILPPPVPVPRRTEVHAAMPPPRGTELLAVAPPLRTEVHKVAPARRRMRVLPEAGKRKRAHRGLAVACLITMLSLCALGTAAWQLCR